MRHWPEAEYKEGNNVDEVSPIMTMPLEPLSSISLSFV